MAGGPGGCAPWPNEGSISVLSTRKRNYMYPRNTDLPTHSGRRPARIPTKSGDATERSKVADCVTGA